MDDFSDVTNRNIIILVVLLYYMFIKYKRTQIMMKKNIKGIKCNPLQMVVGSMFEGSSDNNQFSDCLEYAASEKLLENQNDILEKQKEDYKQLLGQINTANDYSYSANTREKERLFNMVNNRINTVDDLVEQQKEINNNITASETPIKQITDKISSLSNKFKDEFTSFKNSDMVTNLGITPSAGAAAPS